MDPRNRKLAELLIDYSLGLKKGQKLYLEVIGTETLDLAREVVSTASQRGVVPFWFFNDDSLVRRFLLEATEEQLKSFGSFHKPIMQSVDAYIALRGSDNSFTLRDVPQDKIELYNKHFYKPVHFEVRVPQKNWVVLRYPNRAMSQLAETSQEAFADFYYRVCTLDYGKFSKAMDPLKDLMEKTERVHIKGPGTDLRFSIQGIGVVKCDGHRNIPDGEVYTAPVKDSIEGEITYNTPSLYQGTTYERMHFVFEHGKIVKAEAQGDSSKLQKIFDTDAGARFIGEFSLGLNPEINAPMRDTLFDEKIYGSLHLTPGNAYEEADNGNRSAIHWDLVLIQTPEYGGGEIYFDDKLIRKDGEFTIPALQSVLSRKALASHSR
jgi:aminopeptidase